MDFLKRYTIIILGILYKNEVLDLNVLLFFSNYINPSVIYSVLFSCAHYLL